MAAATDNLVFGGPPTRRVILRVVAYYIVLLGLGSFVWRMLPHGGAYAQYSLDSLFGGGAPGVGDTGVASPAVDELTMALTVAAAMAAAILLMLPVAWVYVLTRAKRGYQQSVVQLLIILPLVVAGVVILVKYSVALAFGLTGIVAAVRFRNTLDDSKDAVYAFLAIAIGLAAAVNIPVAAVISILFNVTAVVLWYTDFAHEPIELEGRIAEQRLQRARDLAKTGTFVARIDDEVLANMSPDQLEGVAQRALRHARGEDAEDLSMRLERRLRLRTRQVQTIRLALEPRLDEHAKRWRFERVVKDNDGTEIVEYILDLRKKSHPDALLALARAAGTGALIDVELR